MPQNTKDFQENISTIYDELHLAKQWGKASLILTVHKTLFSQEKTKSALQKKLGDLGYRIVKLDVNGLKYLEDELPERKFIKTLRGYSKFKKVKEKSKLDDEEFQVSLGILKSKMAIDVILGEIKLTQEGKKLINKKMFEEEFLRKLEPGLLLNESS